MIKSIIYKPYVWVISVSALFLSYKQGHVSGVVVTCADEPDPVGIVLWESCYGCEECIYIVTGYGRRQQYTCETHSRVFLLILKYLQFYLQIIHHFER